ncbi:MAG: ATP phosphoribosyltransferase [Pseudomonadota bacterium]
MLNIGLASKGRIQDQTYKYLSAIGLPVEIAKGRSYAASIKALPNAQIWLLPAGEIAKRIHSGALHIGITGHDLLLETDDLSDRVDLLEPLGFARANLVVAVPNSWIDVASIADLREVFADIRVRHGRAPQVATKYTRIVREHFLSEGISDFRLVADPGATEAAPLRGIADVIVDITTSGETLRANDLKPLSSIILKSEAWLAASLREDIWDDMTFGTLGRIMERVTSHKDDRVMVKFEAPSDLSSLRQAVTERFGLSIKIDRERDEAGFYASKSVAFEIASFLQQHTGKPVGVFQPKFILDEASAALKSFRKKVV